MYFRPHLILVPIAWLAAVAVATAQPRVDSAVNRAIARTGSASVIVGVRARFDPPGLLTQDEVASQQVHIRTTIESVIASVGAGLEVGYRYSTIPFFSARVDDHTLAALMRMPDVVTIEADIPEAPALAESIPLINAPAAHNVGATGAGWKVAVLDTGVQTNHPFLAGKTIAEACYSNGGGGGTSVCPGGVNSTAPGSAAPCSVGTCDHGTHVAGIAVGLGPNFTGVAPGAQLIAIQVFTNVGGSASSYVSDQVLAMERVLALAGERNRNHVAAVNLSLGGSRHFDQASCDAASPSRKAIIDNLRSVGIATAIASGNNGFTDSMQIPGCISSAVSVGSTTKTDAVSSFTNRAPFLKLLAPGSSINSSVPWSAFGFKTGTSMAAPHVAGAWAVLKQARPDATVTEVLDALRDTGVPVSDTAAEEQSVQSYPRISVNAALIALVTPGRPTVTSAIEHNRLLRVTWTSGPGAAPTSHRLNFFAGSGPVLSVVTGATTSTDIPLALGTAGSFQVEVVAINSVAQSVSSALFPFTIGLGAPGQPTVTSAVANGDFLNVAWTIGSGPTPTSHRLDFYSGAGLIWQLAVGPAANVAVPIPPGVVGTFGVRVIAFNGEIAGAASDLVGFALGPICNVLAAPTVNGGVSGGVASANWLPVAGATSYLLSVGTTPGGEQYVAQTNVGSSTNVSANGMPSGFFAWVRVIAVNACGQQGPPTDFLVQ